MFESESLKFFYANRGAIDQLGYTEAELLQMHPYDIKPEFPEPQFRSLIAPLVDGNRSELLFETVHRHNDGHDIPVEIFLQYIAPVGEKGRFVAIVRDITQRKQAEEVLRKSEVLYRQAIEIAGAVPYRQTYAENSTHVDYDFIGEGIYEITGYGPKEFNETIWDSLTQARFLLEDLAAYSFNDAIEHVRSGKYPIWKCEHRILARDRKVHWVFEAAVELRDENGISHGSIGMFQDITERKQNQQELEENRRRLAFLLDKSPAVIYSSRATGDFGATFVATNVTSQLGYQPEDFTGNSNFWLEHIHPDDVSRILSELTKLYEQGIYAYEYRFQHKNGHYLWMRDEMTLIRSDSGEPLEVIGAWIDITERKQAEAEREKLIQELTDKNSELERFTYTVSHDLKSPLVTINGYLGYLEQDAATGNQERLKKDTQRIQEAVNKMYRLLNELLDLSRIGRVMNSPVRVQFHELVQEAMDAVRGQINARGVVIRVQPHLPVVYVDQPRMIEVLQNLLDNAIKYMGDQPQPQIEIGQRPEQNGQPVLYIRDNGMGVAPEYHERIFGLFNKLDARSEGTGVGLALVKRIIEVYQGRIWIESELGLGSTFYITLPKVPPGI
jgi:PAS domain S-box-containing protein